MRSTTPCAAARNAATSMSVRPSAPPVSNGSSVTASDGFPDRTEDGAHLASDRDQPDDGDHGDHDRQDEDEDEAGPRKTVARSRWTDERAVGESIMESLLGGARGRRDQQDDRPDRAKAARG